MNDYSHIPVNVIIVKNKDESSRRSSTIRVGDYVTGIEDCPYSVTTKDCVAKVLNVGITTLRIELISHRDPEYISNIGFGFTVEKRYFVKVEN